MYVLCINILGNTTNAARVEDHIGVTDSGKVNRIHAPSNFCMKVGEYGEEVFRIYLTHNHSLLTAPPPHSPL